MERVIDVTLARRQLGTILDEVFHKKDIITIQRKGKSLAKIIPIESENSTNNTLSPTQLALLDEMEALPVVSVSYDPTDILRSMREEKRVQVQAGKKYGK